MSTFFQMTINGLSQGAVYALVALGYTMVYGVLQFINFAHSEIFMMGAFFGLLIAGILSSVCSGFLLVLGVLVGTMLSTVALGLLVERIAYRPLRTAPRLNILITAIGVSLLLQNIAQIVFGADPKFFPSIVQTQNWFEESGLIVNNIQVTVIGLAVVLMLVLHFLVHHTKLGIAMRAVSFDIELAGLMGIPTDKIIIITFAIGCSLAGAASILYGLSYPKIEPYMGVMIGLKAFVAAVFGGIGNIVGAAIGGIFLGLAEASVVTYISSSFKDAIAFTVLILVLLVKPSGLMGRNRPEKV